MSDEGQLKQEQANEPKEAVTAEVVSGPPAILRDDHSGRFVKGVSGNPGGMKKAERAQLDKVRSAARRHAPEAIAVLAELMRAGPPKVRAMCASLLLDRAYGKPPQSITAEGAAAVVGALVVRFENGWEPPK